MGYLYIDESGDLGFEKGSNYFIITCAKIDNEKDNVAFLRIPKKVRQRTLKKKYKKGFELKFTNSSPLIRERYLSRLKDLDLQVFSLIIKKEYTNNELRDNLPILYNYLLKILLEKPLKEIDISNNLTIYLDKCMSKNQMENFRAYIETEFVYLFNKVPKINVVHVSSAGHPGLQVTDFICGAFGYKYNTAKQKGDCESYINLFKDKVIIEKNDLFKKK